MVRVFSPFSDPDNEHPHIPEQVDKEVRIVLPQDKFNESTTMIQICEYIEQSYLIIVSCKVTGKLRAYSLSGLTDKTMGSVAQNTFQFKQVEEQKCRFLTDNFIKVLYVNTKDEILYVLAHKHQIVDGEIYFNGLIIANLRTGRPIEKGYCSLRNIDFSPNHRYILDVPYEYDKICHNQTLFHIRLLLSKSSLYMFLMESSSQFNAFSERFKNSMIELL